MLAAVVIGGGVGGCSILYWLPGSAGTTSLLVERADLTSGSTFHSAGLVGQLRSSLALTRMMMASVDLYRSLEEEVELETGWREVGSLRLASSEERLEEITRQAGWAKTFGLPLELVGAERGAGAVPADVDRRRARRRVPADRRVHRPQPADVRARRGRAAARRRDRDADARDGHPRRATDASRASRPTRVTSRRTIVVNAGGMYARGDRRARGRHRPARADGARVPRARPSGLPHRRCRRCATRRCSSTSAPSPAG